MSKHRVGGQTQEPPCGAPTRQGAEQRRAGRAKREPMQGSARPDTRPTPEPVRFWWAPPSHGEQAGESSSQIERRTRSCKNAAQPRNQQPAAASRKLTGESEGGRVCGPGGRASTWTTLSEHGRRVRPRAQTPTLTACHLEAEDVWSVPFYLLASVLESSASSLPPSFLSSSFPPRSLPPSLLLFVLPSFLLSFHLSSPSTPTP